MVDKPVPRWQKLTALGVVAVLVVVLALTRNRLGADFIPLDASRVGPNLIASAITWACLFVLGVLLWPPTRRRLHRFADAKLAHLHEEAKRAEEHRKWEAHHVAAMFKHMTGRDSEPHPHFADPSN